MRTSMACRSMRSIEISSARARLINAIALAGLGLSVFGCELVVDARDYEVDGTAFSNATGAGSSSAASGGGSVTSCPADMKVVTGGPSGNYCMDTYEVGGEGLAACVSSKECPTYGGPVSGAHCVQGTPGMPANCITWDQATAYCNSRGRRLPIGAEWQWAARGPENRKYPWGNGAPTDQPCWNRLGIGPCSLTANPKDISPFGVIDMGGNVAEWVADAGMFAGRHPNFGGVWNQNAETFRDTLYSSDFGGAADELGFRCVVTLK